MMVGYARPSTLEQVAGFQAQVEALTKSGCEKLFREQVSSVGKRPALEAALEFVREGMLWLSQSSTGSPDRWPTGGDRRHRRYFDSQAPFSSGKKKSEFPD